MQSRYLRLFCLLATLLLFASTAFAQITPGDLHAKLSLSGSKASFRNGEPVELVLELTADREGYVADSTTDECDSPTDRLSVNPDTVNHWRVEAFGRGYRDYSSIQKLSTTPIRIPFVLNDAIRFDQPGRYTIRFTTQRVRPVSPKPNEWLPPIPLTTNEISFEILPMTGTEEQQEVDRILKAIQSNPDTKTQTKLGQAMAFLTGDVAAREKVRIFLNPSPQPNFSSLMYYGIYISRNRELVLQLLESAMRDPTRPVEPFLLGVATSLRFLYQHGATQKLDADMILSADGDPRSNAIRDAYVAELAAGLSKRTSNSQTRTALTILKNLPKEPEANAALQRAARGIVLQQFDTLDEYEQEYLLRQYWSQLRDPSLAPALRKMLSTGGPGTKNNHETALQRLKEIAPEEVRPFVIQEIKDPKSLVEVELLGSLKDQTLPEVDAVLLDQIKQLASSKVAFDQFYLRQKASLAARYATDAIYQEMAQLYRDSGARLRLDVRACLLAYLARYDERAALPLIEQEFAQTPQGQEFDFLPVLLRLYFSDGLNNLLLKRLESDDPQIAAFTAYLIGLHGPAKDQAVLEERLARWRKDWGNRREDSEPDQRGMIESEIIQSLIRSKAWQLSADRVTELRQSCLSKMCRANVQGVRN